MTARTCEYPAVEPTKGNPAGDCRAPATTATRRGTGSPMPLCTAHADRYAPEALIPLDELEDE